jgi:N-ATPase, AtpR subunit
MSDAGPALVTVWVVAGLGFGGGYFATMRRTVVLYGAHSTRLVPIALTLGRIGAAILFFGLAVQFGAPSLLAAFLGFLWARLLALRAAQSIG